MLDILLKCLKIDFEAL